VANTIEQILIQTAFCSVRVENWHPVHAAPRIASVKEHIAAHAVERGRDTDQPTNPLRERQDSVAENRANLRVLNPH